MLQAKFSLHENQCEFLNNFRLYGFKDKSSMVCSAIEHLERELELQHLIRSAELYAEVYEEDETLQTLTEAAVEG
ncbi:MAG: hypothetical protein GY801_17370 [bacterium]|nr:hypothetical protein [bacterium]